MTALLYARVSTEDQAEKYGLSSQVRALHVLAAAVSVLSTLSVMVLGTLANSAAKSVSAGASYTGLVLMHTSVLILPARMSPNKRVNPGRSMLRPVCLSVYHWIVAQAS